MSPERSEFAGPLRDAHRRSFAVVPGPRFRRLTKHLGIQYNNGTVLETYPIAAGPGTQLLVDALAGHADHLADLLLRDRDGSALRGRGVLFGQAKQRTGQPSWQILQDNLLDLIAGRSQPLAEQFDEFHRQRRLGLHKGDELAPVDDKEFARAVCDG